MKKISLLCGILWSFLCLFAFAFEVPELTGRVVDQAQILSAEDEAKIEKSILNFEKETGGQMAIAVLASLQNSSIEEAGMALMDKWKIGHKGEDNGVILIVVPSERKMRLEVGYGWEDEITDARAGDVIRELKAPFRDKKYAEGILAGVAKTQAFVLGRMPDGSPLPEESWFDVILFWLILVGGSGLVLYGIYLAFIRPVINMILGFPSGGKNIRGGDDNSGFFSGGSGSSGDSYSGDGGGGGGGGASGDW